MAQDADASTRADAEETTRLEALETMMELQVEQIAYRVALGAFARPLPARLLRFLR